MAKIDSIKQIFNNNTVTEDNALEFMISKNGASGMLIKKYIASQLEIKYHLYNLTSSLGYEGLCQEPLLQIINDRNPFLWEQIIELDKNKKDCEITIHDVLGRVNLINQVEYVLPEKIEKLRTELSEIKQIHFIKRYQKKEQIKTLESKLEEDKTQMMTYSKPLSVVIMGEEEFQQKQEAWTTFLNDNLKSYKEKYGSKEGQHSFSQLNDYLIDKACRLSRIDRLKKDIVLNYNLSKLIFNMDFSNMSLEQMVGVIRKEFARYGEGGLSEGYIDQNYRSEDLQTSSLSSNFFRTCTKGQDVGKEMQELSQDYEKLKNVDSCEEYIKGSIDIFQKFIKIHPFNDGNGRTSRYLLNAMLVSKNIVPPVLYDTYMDRTKIDNLSNEYLLNGNRESLYNYILHSTYKQNNSQQNDVQQETYNIDSSLNSSKTM